MSRENMLELTYQLLDESGVKQLQEQVLAARNKRTETVRAAEAEMSKAARMAAEEYDKEIRSAVLTNLRALVERETGATITDSRRSQ